MLGLLTAVATAMYAAPAAAGIVVSTYDYTLTGSVVVTEDPPISGFIDVTSSITITDLNIITGTPYGNFSFADLIGGLTGQNGSLEQIALDNGSFRLFLELSTYSSLFGGTGATIDPSTYIEPESGTCPAGVVNNSCGNTTFTGSLAISSTPLPAALPLFATGLGALGLLGWRRKRKTQAVAA
jgi:hypothetical protein